MIPNEHNQYQTLLNVLPPRITAAIIEVYTKTGCPIEIVILEAVSAMTTAMHGFELVTPNGRFMPTPLYCMGMAPPVSGKSAALWEWYRPIRQFDMSLEKRRASDPERAEHPAYRDLLQLDATWSSLLEAINGTRNGLTVLDEDCIDQLKSDVMKKRGKLNRIFDGSVKESLTRRDHNSLVAFYPSIGICLLTPPEIFLEHQLATRHADRKSGLASRFLYAHSWADRGMELPLLPTPHLNEIHVLATWFLEQRLQRMLAGDTRRIELRLSAEAQSCWAEIKVGISLRMNTQFIYAKDSVGRATEKTWRIAAALHCFNTQSLPNSALDPLDLDLSITPEAIMAAWAIVEWSMFQFAKVFPPMQPKAPKPSRVKQRQLEEAAQAKLHLYSHLCRIGGDTIPWTVAQELSWLSAHKFKTVVAHMKSQEQIELIDADDPILKFSSRFFAETGYVNSIQPAVHGVTQV